VEACKRILRCGYASHGQSVLRRRGMRRLMGPPTGSPVAGRGVAGPAIRRQAPPHPPLHPRHPSIGQSEGFGRSTA